MYSKRKRSKRRRKKKISVYSRRGHLHLKKLNTWLKRQLKIKFCIVRKISKAYFLSTSLIINFLKIILSPFILIHFLIKILYEIRKSYFSNPLDTKKALEIAQVLVSGAGLFAALVAGAGLIVNYNNSNKDRKIAEEKLENDKNLAEKRLISERLNKAIELMSNKSQEEVVIGGIYSLGEIYSDPLENSSTVIQILTTYLRNNSLADSEKSKQPASISSQAALTVIGRREIRENLNSSKQVEEVLDLSRINLNNAKLKGANLQNINFSNTLLINSDLREARLEGVDLKKAKLEDADLRKAKLKNASLNNADLYDAELSDAILEETELRNAYLYNATLKSTNLTNADLAGADLTSANLTGANLTGANLTGANLTGANLTGANLTGARLKSTILYNAKFEKKQIKLSCNFHQAFFTEVVKKSTKWVAKNQTDNLKEIDKIESVQITDASKSSDFCN